MEAQVIALEQDLSNTADRVSATTQSTSSAQAELNAAMHDIAALQVHVVYVISC